MSRKPLSVLIVLSLAGLAACAEVTSPDPAGFCGISGGPGTCVAATK